MTSTIPRVTIEVAALAQVRADWLIAGVWESRGLPPALLTLDAVLGGRLEFLRQRGDLSGKTNELTALLDPSRVAADRLLVIGLGTPEGADRGRLTDAAATATRAVTTKPRTRLAFALPEAFPGLDWRETALAAGIGLMYGCYGPGLYQRDPGRFAPAELALIAPASAPAEEVSHGTGEAQIMGRAVWLARDLVNSPPCDLYPESFADRARQAAESAGVACEILNETRLAEERMGALLAVAQGSERPPRLVVLRYQGLGGAPTLGMVGKGVTFDSGGLSLKNTEQMADMKCDMAGAAAVLGAVIAAAQLRLPVNLLGILALVENLPSGRALKLGDVLRTRSGQTIEVLNTDAEGRLILADALTYAVDQGASRLVDVATLTGACMVALGTEVAGLMGNDQNWCDRVLAAARQAGEPVWQLPMMPRYAERIKSKVADMRNTGGSRYGGAITAAKLLERFVGAVPWAHLDIAGPAWVDEDGPTGDAGGTGCLIRTLVELAREGV